LYVRCQYVFGLLSTSWTFAFANKFGVSDIFVSSTFPYYIGFQFFVKGKFTPLWGVAGI
jgi:hypothetical protein